MKKSFAFDPRCFFALLCTCVFGVLTVVGIKEGDQIGDVLSAATIGGLLTLVFVACIITTPKIYIGDEKGIAIYYLPFIKEYFRWNEIKRIRLKAPTGSARSFLFEFLFREYEIVPIKEKSYKGDKYHSIFHNSEISRTFLTKRIIKKYWNGEIEDDTFSWFRKHFKKGNNEAVKYDFTEVRQKEKKARDTVKEISEKYKSKAALYGKTLDTSMTYFTDETDFNNRPKVNYSYKTEIFVEKENDEEKSFYIDVEMLFVSYGKNKIKIIENKNAVTEIDKLINEAIEK